MSTPLEPSHHLDPTGGGDNLENAIELKDVEGLSQGQIVRRRFFRHRGALVRAGHAGADRPPRLHLDRRLRDPRLVEVGPLHPRRRRRTAARPP